MQIGDFGTLINLVLLGVTYLILQPLKSSIENLQSSVDVSTKAIDKLQNLLADVRVNVAKVDSSDKSAHMRINELSRQVEDIQNRCINCTCRKD